MMAHLMHFENISASCMAIASMKNYYKCWLNRLPMNNVTTVSGRRNTNLEIKNSDIDRAHIPVFEVIRTELGLWKETHIKRPFHGRVFSGRVQKSVCFLKKFNKIEPS